MIDHGKYNVLSIRIDAVDYDAAVERIVDAAQSQRPMAVSALAVHGVMTGALDPVHRYRLNQFELLVPDGQPVRWALNWLYRIKLNERVYGPQLMLCLCEQAAQMELPIFLFGGTAELLTALQTNLLRKYPGLKIAGTRPSQFRRLSTNERQEIVADIKSSGARIAFVGLGCPRQEVWAYEFKNHLSMPILAVGAAFNFHAGKLSQSPTWLQERGLEWAYRLALEPRRLWKRYLLLNPLYLTMLFMQFSRLKAFNPNQAVQPTEELLYG